MTYPATASEVTILMDRIIIIIITHAGCIAAGVR